ncbi:MAG: sensor histidine kinase [Solirubrobacteraceae bacterium]
MDWEVNRHQFSHLSGELGLQTGALWASAVAVVCALSAALGLLDPAHVVNPAARAALEATISLSALLSAGLLVAHYGQTRRLNDLLLVSALLAVLVGDFVYRSAPALNGDVGFELRGAGALAWELIASMMLAAAAFAPGKTVRSLARGLVALAVVGFLTTVILGDLLVDVDGPSSTANIVERAGIASATNHPVAATITIIAAALLVVAGLAFLHGRRDARLEDGLLAGAAFLLAGAVLQYLAMPVVATDWVTPRDGLRLAAYLLVVASAFSRYLRTRDDQTRAAISSERERIARDLHDGLAQDLACIATQSQRLGVRLGPDHPLVIATRHALAASRGAITDLGACAAPSTEAALCLIADELEHRYSLQVRVRIEPENALSGERDLEPPSREHVIRIAREAIVNAAVHGMARRVDVVLQRRESDLLLRVSDDGRGIADSRHHGFGLRTMHARAASLGGRLTAHRRADGGTELKLRIP